MTGQAEARRLLRPDPVTPRPGDPETASQTLRRICGLPCVRTSDTAMEAPDEPGTRPPARRPRDRGPRPRPRLRPGHDGSTTRIEAPRVRRPEREPVHDRRLWAGRRHGNAPRVVKRVGRGDCICEASCAVIPEETAGPFPGDGSNGPDVLSEAGVVRKDIRSSFGASSTVAEGIPLAINLTIQDAGGDCAPLAGAAVYIWHCDRGGAYSLYSEAAADENYLRGVQAADDAGLVTFQSIFPACYPGRWPHIHFEVFPSLDLATDEGEPDRHIPDRTAEGRLRARLRDRWVRAECREPGRSEPRERRRLRRRRWRAAARDDQRHGRVRAHGHGRHPRQHLSSAR